LYPDSSNPTVPKKGDWHEAPEIPHASPATGSMTTTADLAKFARALEQHKLLDKDHTDLMTATKTDAFPGEGYAFGFETWKLNDETVYGHTGTFMGINSSLQIFPKSHLSVSVLSNLDPPSAIKMSDWIKERFEAAKAADQRKTSPG
jgi:CubicO group peptidase (beta-lactamase class C family)